MDDPRPLLHRALDQVDALVGGTRTDQLDLPTPCAGWDVRALIGHLIDVERMLAGVATGRPARDDPPAAIDADPARTLAAVRADLDRAWADDAVLDRDLVLAWGTMPGRVVATAYAQELTAHAWDLAVATARTATLDRALAEEALDDARELTPAEGREHLPFGPVVDVADDADPYHRLVGWFGRDPDRHPTHHSRPTPDDPRSAR